MKTLLMFSTAVLLFASCNNIAALKAPIEELASNWENTTTMMTDFVNTLQGTQSSLQDQFAQMQVPEGMQLDEEASGKVNELKSAYQEQIAGLSTLSESVSSFAGDWQTKAQQLGELKDGLASGKLGSDAMTIVESLTGVVAEAKTGLEDWQGDLGEIKENSSSIFQQFTGFINSIRGN